MQSPFQNIIAKNESQANMNGSWVNWGLFAIIILNLLMLSISRSVGVSLSSFLLAVAELLVISLTNLFIYWRKGQGKGIRYLLVAVMLLVGTCNAFIVFHLWAIFYILPVVFSIRYCKPRFTIATGIVASLLAAVVGNLLLYLGFTANGYVNLDFVEVTEPVVVDLREGFYGIYGPVFESGKIDEPGLYKNFLFGEFPAFLTMILITIVCGVIARRYRHNIQVELENVEKSVTIAEQRLREKDHQRQIAEMQDLNTQLSKQREVASEARRAAELANRTKTLFLNHMSHDLRTPMNAIIGYTALASTNPGDQKLLQEYLSKVSSSSQYMLSLINGMLDVNSLESGDIQPQLSENRLSDILHNLRSVVLGAVNAKRLNLFINTQDVTEDVVLCDPLRLGQVLINLASSAVKHTPAGGTVSILLSQFPTADERRSVFEFRIKDTGPGMDREKAAHVFEQYTLDDDEQQVRHQTKGLGMYITKCLTDLMGGNIQVTTEKTKGTEFVVSFTFQTVVSPTIAAQTSSEQSTHSMLEGMHVLLAEDNALNQEIISTQLQGVGFHVDVAQDGLEAVSRVMNQPAGTYNFVLMDVVMPRMDGYEATRIIRAIPDAVKSQIPIIAISANAFENDKISARNAGMNGHIAKPIDLPTLLAEISRILKG